MSERIIKYGFSDASVVKQLSTDEIKTELASPHVTRQLEKFANTIRAIAPKSDDFLYFTIIFLKSAESSLIDDSGDTKKLASGEKAWGYFDDNWKWQGNVKPHKNANGDIFPEKELKTAFRDWIGKPLCVDHKSDSVDGIRGIILDTYYDEKLKQVVGLCALDKINYPDLARNVKTGVVRYGSMGTAVNLSICTECSQKASTPKEYCSCIINKQAWGEINVGLKPIEYSLVVQPAEPGARLLRCIASINMHDKELSKIGINASDLTKTLTVDQADNLDLLLNSVCGNGNSCSLQEREKIIRGYLNTNGFTKSASIKRAYNKELLEDLARFEAVFGVKYMEDPELYEKFFGEGIVGVRTQPPAADEILSSESPVQGGDTITMKDDQGVSDFTGTGSSGLVAGVTEPNPDSFKGDGVGPEHYAMADEILENIKLSTITEEIMNEARKRKRAELRRRLAHPLGASNPAAEPSTFKNEGNVAEKARENDKYMHQTKSMGGDKGVFPGDEKLKEKLLRAEDTSAEMNKTSYFQGGADPAVEPATFKSEDYHKYWEMDKYMHQTKSMGGDKGTFPGDEKIKQNLKRAKYTGPALSTKFKQRKTVNGAVDKDASCFEVYSGDKLVIAATAKDIFGSEVEKYWSWITSQDYAKKVVSSIREDGIGYIGNLLTKKAQELPAMPPMEEAAPLDLGAPAEAGPMDAMEPMMEDAPLDMETEGGSPKAEVEDALISMEDSIEKAREALSGLTGGEDVDINVNVGQESEMPEEKLALSKQIVEQLKVVIADARDSADELALLAETYEKVGNLSASQRRALAELRQDAMMDYATITGRTNVLVTVARTISDSLVKTSEFVESKPVKTAATKEPVKDTTNLVSGALELRKLRRQQLLKKATEQVEEAKEKEVAENEAHDGIGMKENAPVAGVATDTAQTVAEKEPKATEHGVAPSKGNSDVKGFDSYLNTPTRQLAEKSLTSVNHAEDEMTEKEEENEEKTTVQSKLTDTFMKKKSEEELDSYRTKLRRAYDVAMDMQRKGMLAPTKPALDKQVDCIMEFDDKAFEAFKRSVANTQTMKNIKTATDLSGVNIGISEETVPAEKTNKGPVDLSKLWP